MRARALGEVAVVALLSRDSENIAARFERRPNSRRRERRVADHCDYFLELRARPRQIAGDFDVESLRPFCLCIDEINVAGLLVNNGVRPCRRCHDVKVIVMGELFDLLRVATVGEQVHCVIAVREKVDRISNPHREGVVAVVPGKFLDRIVAEIHHGDWVSATTPIVPPHTGLVPLRNERSRDLLISDATPIGRVRGAERARHR